MLALHPRDGDSPPVVLIRHAEHADAEQIATVHVRGWQVGYAGILPSDYLRGLSTPDRRYRWDAALVDPDRRGDVLVAVERDCVVGFTRTGPSRDTDADHHVGELYALYVHPARWGHGIGHALTDMATDTLRAAEYHRATLWVLEANDRAQRFYRRVGWKPDGTSKIDAIGDGTPLRELRFATELRPLIGS